MTAIGGLDAIVASHRALRRFLGLVDGGDEQVLLAQLEWLRTGLPRHFALEEQPGGFFDAVGRRGGPVEALRGEHRQLERDLRELTTRRDRGEDVTEALRTLGRALAAHEAREAKLGLDMDDLALPRR